MLTVKLDAYKFDGFHSFFVLKIRHFRDEYATKERKYYQRHQLECFGEHLC